MAVAKRSDNDKLPDAEHSLYGSRNYKRTKEKVKEEVKMPTSKEDVSKMAKVEANTPDISYSKEKYPLARSWNKFVKCMQEAKEEWIELQKEMDFVGRTELEDYPVVAQRHIGRFRSVNFEWMASMFVDYYRGAGGLESMFIILPPEPKEEKKDDSK